MRFGVFELDTGSGELRKSGARIRVADQSIQILTTLLARPGDVVTRQELKALLWPNGVNVDFESGLNSAVKKLRIALGDSGATPRYIETLPRRGYRLIVPVDSSPARAQPAGEFTHRRFRFVSRRNPIALAVLLALLLIAAGVPLAPWVKRRIVKSVDIAPVGFGRPSANAEADGYFSKAQLFSGTAGVYDLNRVRHLLERALQLDPHFGKARAEYGFTDLLMVIQGRSNDPAWLYTAEEQIQQGLRDDPTFSHGHAALAALCLLHGRREEAPIEAAKALKLNPRDIDARHWLAVYHLYSGDTIAARQLEIDNVARNAHFFPAHMTLGDLARQDGNWEGSLREHQQVLEYDPNNSFVLQFLARTHIDRGDFAQARQALNRLRTEDRSSFWARSSEALLLASQGNRAEAMRAMDQEVLKYLDLNPFFTLTGAEFYAVMGDVPRAFEWLERAIRNGDRRPEWFARDPALENIRREGRFHLILNSLATNRSSGAGTR